MKDRQMGHAGAIISTFGESAPEEVEIMRAAVVTIAPTPADMGRRRWPLLARRADKGERRAG